MTHTIVNVPAKDGNGSSIPNGVEFVDVSGTGTGPYIIGKSIIDAEGTNVANVTAAGAVKVDASATTQPISGTVTLGSGSNVVGHVIADTGSTTAVTGNVTVVQGTASNLKVDLSGTSANATAIKVDGSSVTQPISGTVTANQGGTWTVQPGNTANTTAWKVDGSAVTQPISAGSLPLPTGAATSGNQSTEITALNQLHTDLTTGPVPVTGSVTTSGTVTVSSITAPVTVTGSLTATSTPDVNIAAATTSDAPLFTTITGDPNGDFAGINILEKLVDDSGDLSMAVKVVNPPKLDARGAQMASDAPAPINLTAATGQFVYIDTTGYQSLEISAGSGTTGGTFNPIAGSNDGITWNSILGYPISGSAAAPSVSVSAGQTAVFPVNTKLVRIAVSSGGNGTAYLRNIPAPNPAVIMPQNISQIGGSSVQNAGFTGTLAVGGNVSNTSTIASAANPIPMAGVDLGTPGFTPLSGGIKGTPALRTFLTDNTGRLRLAQETPVQTIQNVPALNVQDISQTDGQTRDEFLSQILLELKILNQQIYQLPQTDYRVLQSLQSPPTTQNIDYGAMLEDEPAAFRQDITIFNNFN